MTATNQENTPIEQQPQVSNKELNFRALEAKYQQQLAREREEKERLMKELEKSHNTRQDDDEDNEPYVDHKRLKKEQAKFGQQIKQETQTEIQKAVSMALQNERKQQWLKNNPDFQEIMSHAEKFAMQDPELAETILEMPDTFERQKLVYKNIKALGLHKPPVPQSSIQEKIDANRKSPYYQSNGTSAAPYSPTGDFSASGQKSAYEKMQQLKARYGM